MAFHLTRFNLKTFQNISSIYSPSYVISRTKFLSPKAKKDNRKKGTIKHRNLIKSDCESLAARGFLRSQKPYTPKPDVEKKLEQICNNVLGSQYGSNDPLPRDTKFNLLNICFKEIGYSIPNSLLCHITTAKEVLEFYMTPISTTIPYDELRNRDDLPPNLYLQPDYVRYNPDDDRYKFSPNATPFPHSSTLVTGLKARQKYKSIYTKPIHHYYNEADFIKNDHEKV